MLQLFNNWHLHSANNVFADDVDKISIHHMSEWQMSIGRKVGTNRKSRNKLRFNRLFKRFFSTEEYCKVNMPFSHREAYAQFRCGVASIKIETIRYLGQPLDARICLFCPNQIEDEHHVILQCPAYDPLRQNLFRTASTLFEGFCRINDIEKIIL